LQPTRCPQGHEEPPHLTGETFDQYTFANRSNSASPAFCKRAKEDGLR
jgi:hypothetical protein